MKKFWGATGNMRREVCILKLGNVKKNVLAFSFYILLTTFDRLNKVFDRLT